MRCRGCGSSNVRSAERTIRPCLGPGEVAETGVYLKRIGHCMRETNVVASLQMNDVQSLLIDAL